MFTDRPKHLKSFDYRGAQRYFLTFCTFERRHLFTDEVPVDLTRSQILRAETDEGFTILAYCFMPDHLHLLVEGTREDSDCLRFIARAKQFSGFHFKKRFGRPLWQRYGFERTLRNDEKTLSGARYIFDNPVRAGLVRTVDEYPFLGSSMYSVQEVLDAVQWSREWPSG